MGKVVDELEMAEGEVRVVRKEEEEDEKVERMRN